MTKNSKRFKYILIGFLVLTSINLGLFNYQNSNDYREVIDENEFKVETNDILYLPFIVGVSSGPVTIDPADCWEVASWNVIEQVCEGLFRTNLSDPDLPRINWLAESYWWENETTLRLKLREGVLFHDNTLFNANAAKWNLDRINYLTNISGTLPGFMESARPTILWKLPNGTGIMKQIDLVSEYNITIHLNSPYSPFLDLLSSTQAYMISPTSNSQTDYIDISTGDLVGTGPFEYDNYDSGIEVNFHAFDNYWGGKANITDIKYQIISDPTSRNIAMLNGDIDYLYGPDKDYYSSFAADPDIMFTEAPKSGLTYYYIGMNNNKINSTWRKAVSYAINYSYIIQEMRDNYAVRAHSPIAPSFGNAYYNCSSIAPYYNLTIARQNLIDDPGIDTTGLTANNNPDDVAWEASDLATFNYTYPNWGFWADLSPILVDWCDNIGINVYDNPIPGWSEWIDFIENSKHKFSLFSSGWGPDYLEAFNLINPLFSNSSDGNWASVNDPWIQMKLEEAIETTDDSARNTIYHDIQIYLSSNLYPHAFLFHPRNYFVYSVDLTNYPHNALGRLYLYPCEWIPSIYKDITNPLITINEPDPGDVFTETIPIYDITIIEDNLESFWYTLETGGTPIPISAYSGSIDEGEWNTLPYGEVTITFYAIDTVGNVGYSSVIVSKNKPEKIPSAYPSLVLMIMFLGIVALTWRQKQKQK